MTVSGIFHRLLTTRNKAGFTLAELMVALGVLGVIFAFTIPKILDSNAASTNKASSKEAQEMLNEAYTLYQTRKSITTSTNPNNLTQYMNYVAVITNQKIDSTPGQNWQFDCSASGNYCLKLHSGGLMWFNGCGFSDLSSTSAIYVHYDANGLASNVANVDGLMFLLYPNGLTRTRGTMKPNSFYCGIGPESAGGTNLDPSWF